MSENVKKEEEKKQEKKDEKSEELVEGMKDFLSAHELQLYGMQFPKELEEKLYT